MMSEKRFEMKIPINNGNHPLLKDNETGEIVEIVNVEMLIKKMNEQQSTIDKVYELLKEEADIFSDEATEHDIKAYIELQEFDNKDAYYLACAIKKAIKLLKGDDV